MGSRVPEIGLILVAVTRWYSAVSAVCEMKVLLEIDSAPLRTSAYPRMSGRDQIRPGLAARSNASPVAAPVRSGRSRPPPPKPDVWPRPAKTLPVILPVICVVRTFFTAIEARQPEHQSVVPRL